MSCNCSKAKPIPSCVTDLIIGSANTSYNYLVYLRTATGRTDVYTGAFIYGTDSLSISDFNVRIGDQYEIWITKEDADSIEDREEFTVDGQSVTCIEAQFEYCAHELSTQEIRLTAEGCGTKNFTAYGNDTDTVIIPQLIGKELLSLSTDNSIRNFDDNFPPTDAVFTSSEGKLVFASTVASTSVIQGTYK